MFRLTARARILHPVSGGQYHLIHLTIIGKFSRPSLAYMCTRVAQNPIPHFVLAFIIINGLGSWHGFPHITHIEVNDRKLIF